MRNWHSSDNTIDFQEVGEEKTIFYGWKRNADTEEKQFPLHSSPAPKYGQQPN